MWFHRIVDCLLLMQAKSSVCGLTSSTMSSFHCLSIHGVPIFPILIYETTSPASMFPILIGKMRTPWIDKQCKLEILEDEDVIS